MSLEKEKKTSDMWSGGSRREEEEIRREEEVVSGRVGEEDGKNKGRRGEVVGRWCTDL